jgi:integrase
LRRVIRESRHVSRSCRLLGEWIRSLIWRAHRGRPIAISSLSRYLNALSVCFEAVAAEHDLLSCDGDEVTEFYRDVMDARSSIRPHTYKDKADSTAATEPTMPAPDQHTGSASTSINEEDVYKTRRLALQLLRDFHALMSRHLAIADPDWSEIDGGDDVLSISPGILREAEYRYALALAAPKPELASRDDLARAFILLVAMRFGLRGAEITGLLRTDWVDSVAGTVIVLVQKNKHRALKTPAARRQVPLLFALTDAERTIIERFLASWEGIARGDVSVPLFVNTTDENALMHDKFLRYQASQLIKRATLNQSLSLHHARHTFANRVGLTLLTENNGLWPRSVLDPMSSEDRSHVRKLLLCSNHVTRRSLWALARLLGHAHPQTTLRSYVHFVPDLADWYVWGQEPETTKNWPTPLEALLRLDDLKEAPDYMPPMETAVTFERLPPPTLQVSLRLLSLYQRGGTPERASLCAGMEHADAKTLLGAIESVDRSLARRPHANPLKTGASIALSHIPPERWSHLIRWAGLLTQKASCLVASPEHMDRIAKMIGPSRQLLLFRPEHFKLFRQLIDFWGLPASMFRIVSQKEPHATVLGWATQTGLLIETLESIKNEIALQLDVVEDGDPPTPQRHRCAVLLASLDKQTLQDSFEFVILFVVTAFSIAAQLSTDQLQVRE